MSRTLRRPPQPVEGSHGARPAAARWKIVQVAQESSIRRTRGRQPIAAAHQTAMPT